MIHLDQARQKVSSLKCISSDIAEVKDARALVDECGEHGHEWQFANGKITIFSSILRYVKSTNVYVKLSDDWCWPLIGVAPPTLKLI